MKSAILYGPPGSGKTFNAKRIMNQNNLKTVVDGVSLEEIKMSRIRGALFVTNEVPPPEMGDKFKLINIKRYGRK